MSTLNNVLTKPEVEGRKLSIVEALREALQEEMRRDERVILIGEDIGIKGGFGGAFTVTLGLSDEFGSERVIDTPDLGSRIHRDRGWSCSWRAAAGCGRPVRRLSFFGHGPTGQPCRQDALHVRRQAEGPHGDAGAGGRDNAWLAACTVAGVLFRACSRTEDCVPIESLRRQGTVEDGHSHG